MQIFLQVNGRDIGAANYLCNGCQLYACKPEVPVVCCSLSVVVVKSLSTSILGIIIQ
jgi:hypothetical protein